MCVYSMIQEQIPEQLKPFIAPTTYTWPNEGARVAELERKVADLERMLKAAKLYDEEHHEPDCETEDKIALVRELCKELGIDPARLTE